MKRFIAAMILALMPAAAPAQDTERPNWSFEIKGGAVFPAASQWSKFYGDGYMGEYGASLSYKFTRQLEAGIEGSYARATGKGVQRGVPAGEVTHEQVPLDLFVLARGVFNENQWLVPYAGGGYTRFFYRDEIKGQGTSEGSADGFHLRGGIQLLLDRLEPESARDLRTDFGLDNTYFILEGKYVRATADTVSGGSVNLGGSSVTGGFLFEF